MDSVVRSKNYVSYYLMTSPKCSPEIYALKLTKLCFSQQRCYNTTREDFPQAPFLLLPWKDPASPNDVKHFPELLVTKLCPLV